MAKSTLIAALASATWLLVAVPAQAGRSCEAKKPSTQTMERGLTLAQYTLTALNASGAQVVLLARAGQDLRKYGLRYSHFGLAYKTSNAQGQPVWRVVHKLNHCGTTHAAVYRQGLGEFFLDDLWRFEAAWVPPRPELQQRLLALLQDERRVVSLHHKPYSIVSYAWGLRYQQSNQWALETLAAAMQSADAGVDPVAVSRQRAQAWLRQQHYHPARLELGPLTRLGGRLSAANVAFDDHPPEQRWSNRIETVSVDSVFEWLQRSGLGGAPVRLQLP